MFVIELCIVQLRCLTIREYLSKGSSNSHSGRNHVNTETLYLQMGWICAHSDRYSGQGECRQSVHAFWLSKSKSVMSISKSWLSFVDYFCIQRTSPNTYEAGALRKRDLLEVRLATRNYKRKISKWSLWKLPDCGFRGHKQIGKIRSIYRKNRKANIEVSAVDFNSRIKNMWTIFDNHDTNSLHEFVLYYRQYDSTNLII